MVHFDMVTFMTHVRSANWFLDVNGSSLTPLFPLLGGIPPADTRVGQPAALRAVHEDPIIDMVMGGNAGAAGMPLEKRKRYKNALGYLFAQMQLPPPLPGGGGAPNLPAAKRFVTKHHREIKANWTPGATGAGDQLVHCSNVTPQKIRAAGGFDPQFSSEFCTAATLFNPAPAIAWPGHEYTFFFERRRAMGGGGGWARLQPTPGGARFGFGNYLYLLRPALNTPFMSQGGAIVGGREIACPHLIPLADLIPYRWAQGAATQLLWTGAVARGAQIIAV
jgi:hypothetical protein